MPILEFDTVTSGDETNPWGTQRLSVNQIGMIVSRWEPSPAVKLVE